MGKAAPTPKRSTLHSVTSVLANGPLRNLVLAWTLSWIEDWLLPIAVSLYLYEREGAVAVGLAGAVRMLPAALAAPSLSVLVDRWPRERVLRLAYATQALAAASMVVAFAWDAPLWVLYVLLCIEGTVVVVIQPATSALVPWLARSPLELTAANATLTIGRAFGVFLGPLLAGVLIAAASAGWAFAVCAALMTASTVLALALRVSAAARQVRHREHRYLRDLSLGFDVLWRDSAVRAISLRLAAVQGLLRGLFGVVSVVAAVEVLDATPVAAGYLQAGIGLGGVIGGVLLVRSSRLPLARGFVVGMTLRTLPFAALGLLEPHVAAAVALMLVNGVGNTAMLTSAQTLLQRIVPNDVLGRVLGATGMLTMLGVVVGSAAAPPLLHVVGAGTVLVALGVVFPLVAVVGWPTVRQAESRATAHDDEVAVLRGVPFLAALPLVALDACAGHVTRERVERGAVVTRQGEAGDRFYVVLRGAADIDVDGQHVGTVRRGGYFGERALLWSGVRMATVVMAEPGELAVIDREHFLRALSFDDGMTDQFAVAPTMVPRRAAASLDPVTALGGVACLGHLSRAELERLAAHSQVEVSPAGDVVVRKGAEADAFFVVLEGSVAVDLPGREPRVIAAGGWFGEVALVKREARTATVRSRSARLLRLPGDEFLAVVDRSTLAG